MILELIAVVALDKSVSLGEGDDAACKVRHST